MLKKTMTYVDFDNNTRTEDFYFNLTKAEVLEMQMVEVGGLEQMLRKMIAEQNIPQLIKYWKFIILKAYGQKSPDGRRFMKSEEIANSFSQTNAYSDLYMELSTDGDKAADFVNAIMPQDLSNPEGPTLLKG